MRTKILVVLFFVVVIGTVSIYYVFKPVTADGVVAHKAINGERNNVAYTIIRFHELGINPKIDDWESLFPNTTRISEEAKNQLETRYTNLRYVINVRTKSKTMGYYASKDDFNKVDPGDAVKFKILRRRDPTIKINEVVSREVDEAKPVGGSLTSLVPQAIILSLILLTGFFLLLRFALHRWIPTTLEHERDQRR